jgi:hypothetical protein
MGSSSDDLQDELLNKLSADILTGRIRVGRADSDSFSKLTGKFPTGISGILWDRVFDHRLHASPQPKLPIEMYLPIIKRVLGQFAIDAEIGPDDVVHVVGDGVTNVTLTMPLSLLWPYLPDVLSLPQATFIIKNDYEWCFCYTFEDDMYYGKSPH